MKKQLFLIAPALLMLVGCSSQPGGSSVSPTSAPTSETTSSAPTTAPSSSESTSTLPPDPEAAYKVTADEGKDAVTFKDISNLTMNKRFVVTEAKGKYYSVQDSDVDYLIDGNKMRVLLTGMGIEYTSVAIYQKYCEDEGIEYKESDYQALLSDLGRYADNHETIDGVEYFSSGGSNDQYYEEKGNHYGEMYESYDSSYLKNAYGYGKDDCIESDYKGLIDPAYIDFETMDYGSTSHSYKFSDDSLGGFFHTDEKYIITYEKIEEFTVAFENKKLVSASSTISGIYKEHAIKVQSTYEFSDYGTTVVSMPTDFTPNTCEHDGRKTIRNMGDYGYTYCEDCDYAIPSSIHEHQFDEEGICAICSEEHRVEMPVLTKNWFGYPLTVLELFYYPELDAVNSVNYINQYIVGSSSPFTYFEIPETSDAVQLYTPNGEELYWGNGNKICFPVMIGNIHYYYFASEYHTEERTIKGEQEIVLIIDKMYHDRMKCTY